MTQGRKSKTVLALVSALAFVALAIPALAAAQAADDEYNLTLPGAGGSDSGSSTQSASGTTTGTGAKASSASTSGGAGTTGGDNAVAATAAGSSGDGSGAKRREVEGEERRRHDGRLAEGLQRRLQRGVPGPERRISRRRGRRSHPPDRPRRGRRSLCGRRSVAAAQPP